MEQPEIVSVRDFEEHRVVADFAQAIAKEKIAKGSKLRLPIPVGTFAKYDRLYDLISACGDTANEHGFWDAHAEKAVKILGLDWTVYQAYRAVFRTAPSYENATQAQRDIVDGLSIEHRARYSTIQRLAEGELLGDPAIFLALTAGEAHEAIEGARVDNWSNPSGVWEELADVTIRMFDFIARYGPRHEMPPSRFLAMIQAKMAVNEARPPKHGKNF